MSKMFSLKKKNIEKYKLVTEIRNKLDKLCAETNDNFDDTIQDIEIIKKDNDTVISASIIGALFFGEGNTKELVTDIILYSDEVRIVKSENDNIVKLLFVVKDVWEEYE